MNPTATLERDMAKKKQPGQRKQDEQSSARIAKDLLRDINILCKHRGVSVTDYIDGVLRPAVRTDFQAFIKDRTDNPD